MYGQTGEEQQKESEHCHVQMGTGPPSSEAGDQAVNGSHRLALKCKAGEGKRLTSPVVAASTAAATTTSPVLEASSVASRRASVVVTLETATTPTASEATTSVVKALFRGWASFPAFLVVLPHQLVSFLSLELDEQNLIQEVPNIRQSEVG